MIFDRAHRPFEPLKHRARTRHQFQWTKPSWSVVPHLSNITKGGAAAACIGFADSNLGQPPPLSAESTAPVKQPKAAPPKELVPPVNSATVVPTAAPKPPPIRQPAPALIAVVVKKPTLKPFQALVPAVDLACYTAGLQKPYLERSSMG